MAQKKAAPSKNGLLHLNGDETIVVQGRTLTTRMLRLYDVRSSDRHMPDPDKHPEAYILHHATNVAIYQLLQASCQTLTVADLWNRLNVLLDDIPKKNDVIRYAIVRLRKHVRREKKLALRQDARHAAYLMRKQSALTQ